VLEGGGKKELVTEKYSRRRETFSCNRGRKNAKKKIDVKNLLVHPGRRGRRGGINRGKPSRVKAGKKN